MAYLSLVEYDAGGRIQSLDGLAAVTYDDGSKRNLLGANLGAVKYDDGGRFRTLLGLGQDELPPEMPPPDVGLDPSISSGAFPISYAPPSPAPSMLPFVPSPVVDTSSAPITGTLVDTGAPQSAGPGGTGAPVSASVLTSIFSGVRNIFSGVSSTVRPAGTVVPTGVVAPQPSAGGWFSQPSAIGVPNWGMLAGICVGGLLLVRAMRGGSDSAPRRRNPGLFSGIRAYKTYRSRGAKRGEAAREAAKFALGRKRNPRRRKNPAELILMGANPHRRRRR